MRYVDIYIEVVCCRLNRRSLMAPLALLESPTANVRQLDEDETYYAFTCLAVWLSDNTLVSINEVSRRCARLVLGWVTVSGVQLPGESI